MKKFALVLLCLLLLSRAKSQSWELSLNNLSSTSNSPNFGTSSNHPINFFTNDTIRMSLTTLGILKINKLSSTNNSGSRFLRTCSDGSIAEWKGAACDSGKVLFGDNKWRDMPVRSKQFTGGPFVVDLGGDPQGAIGWKPPCNVNWNPTQAQTGHDIFQIQHGNNTAVLNLGLTAQGDGIVAVEPVSPPGSQKLKLNPSCNNGVEICEGGGFTKIFYSASIGANLKVGPGGVVASGSQMDIVLDPSAARAITIIDPSLSSLNKNIFELSKAGGIIQGVDVQATPGTMLTIGQPTWYELGLSLVDNSVSPNVPFFNVLGNGFTEIVGSGTQAFSIRNRNNSHVETFAIQTSGHTQIKTSNTKAFSIYNASNSNNETFCVNNNGYTEIRVYSPSGMPAPYSSGHRALTIRDMSNSKDIFVVNSNGKTYAREVEISLATDFPDYVFDKDYDLKTIAEAALFIKENKHLPGFEKADYYEKNGINVNEMFVKQQEKIEELMLYIIQLEKRLQAVEKK